MTDKKMVKNFHLFSGVHNEASKIQVDRKFLHVTSPC